MCLIAFAINASPRWPLVIASNRDEFLDRPTRPLARWKTASGQEIISGRDERAGGTWLGVTLNGRVAFLTNVHEPKCGSALSSRGELVTRWLEGNGTVDKFSAVLQNSDATYSGFNLVLGDLQRNAWTWLTNRSTATNSGWQAQALLPGVYGLSNAALDTPWPKTVELKRVLSSALLQSEESDSLYGPLWLALAKRAQMPPAKSSKIGIFHAMEPAATSAFVDIPEHAYGTRSSTVLVVSRRQDQSPETPYRTEVRERTHMRESADEVVVGFKTSIVTI